MAASPARPLEVAAPEVAFGLQMSDDGLDGGAASQLALDDTEDAALLAGDEDTTGILCVVAAVSLVDIGPLDWTAGECLGAINDVAQSMTVVRVIGHRPGVQHEQATGSPAVVGDDGGFHAELVRRGGLALADALHLRGMEGIELPAALALLLRADLRGPAKREGERPLQCWPALDLAADVADDPPQPAAQDTQLPLMPPELFGMA